MSTTQSAVFKKANQLMREGYDRKQAFAIAYAEKGEPKRKAPAKKAPARKRTWKNPASVNIDVDVSSHNARGRKSGTAVKSNPKRKTATRKNPVAPKVYSRPRKAAVKKRIYTVEMSKTGEAPWSIEGIFPTAASAKEYAHALDAKHSHMHYIRVTV